jgi:hypothetical protein
MKTKNQNISVIFLILFFTLFLASCKKENSADTSAVSPTSISNLQAVAVAAGTTSNDSIYVIGICVNSHHLDSVSLTNLPATVTDYLTTNYDGYTFQKAFTDKDLSGNTAGYVVIIQYNRNPVGLKFDASGNFIRVLEQREGRDLSGKGWHDGGRFNDRDGRHRDTVALTSLPATVLSYFISNYPGDTLVRAYKNRDSSYVLFSKNNGAFATLFDANGTFIKRAELYEHTGNVAVVDQTTLSTGAQDYLSSTYPDYVFKQAFSFSENGVLLGYVVCIDANGTKYAIEFNASGNFISAFTLR